MEVIVKTSLKAASREEWKPCEGREPPAE